MQVCRLFEMLYLLLENEQMTAPELAKRLEVSVRTVYRDVQTLSEAGVPVYARQGQSGGVSILPGYKISKSFLSRGERAGLLASLQAMAQTGAGEQDTLRKLSALFGADGGGWVRIDFADWTGAQDALLLTIKTAILEQRVLAFDYFAEASTLCGRRVCPIQLWFKGQSWYLRAYCLERNAMRTFKLSRMRSAQLVPGAFPPEAEAAHLYDEPGTDWEQPEYQEVVLRVAPCMAFRALDDFGERSITRLEGGDLLVKTRFPQGAWIASVILGYGAHCEVLGPEALRRSIRETIKKMNEIYET